MAIFKVNGAHRQRVITHIFNIEVLSYFDEGVYYMAAPVLDIVGAGETELQAKESFDIVLEEFIKYTGHKRTIQVELKRLGWTITSSRNKASAYHAPKLESFANNPEYTAIFAKKPIIKVQKVALPL